MGIYLLGSLIAFCIGFIRILASIRMVFSLSSRNFKKIDTHYSFFQSNFTSESPPTFLKFSIFSAYVLLLAPTFSWFSVFSSTWGLLSWHHKKSETPEKIKEILFKIKNINLSKKEMKNLNDEYCKILNIPKSNSTDSTLVLEEGESSWYHKITVDTESKTYISYSHTPDYSGEQHAKIEYRFENLQIQSRVIESYTSFYGKKDWTIKDNVVLENEIRERSQDRDLDYINEQIAESKGDSHWEDFTNYKIRYFLLKHHSEVINEMNLKKLTREDLERLKTVIKWASKVCKTFNLTPDETKDGLDFIEPSPCSDEQSKNIQHFISEEFMSKMNTSIYELRYYKSKIKYLEQLLINGENA